MPRNRPDPFFKARDFDRDRSMIDPIALILVLVAAIALLVLLFGGTEVLNWLTQ